MKNTARNYNKGKLGEDIAAEYFKEKGYEVLEKRFKLWPGEVDIILRKDDVIVFVEVKTWDVLGMESLEHAIDKKKCTTIKKMASLYLNSHLEFGDCRIRFDLVFLSRKTKKLDHWEHAF